MAKYRCDHTVNRGNIGSIDVVLPQSGGTAKVTLPSNSRVWNVFQGTNTLTKRVDVFISFKEGDGSYSMYRLSGKHGYWQFHASVSRNSNPTRHLREYAKVTDVKKLAPVRLSGCGQENHAASCCGQNHVASCCVQQKPQNERKSIMGGLDKVFGRFGKCEKGAYALSVDGTVAIRRQDGNYATLKDGGLVNIEQLKIDVEAFFYLPVAPAQVAVGDIVVVGKGLGFVTAVAGNDVSVFDVNNEVISTIKPIRHFLMPTPFLTKVVNLLGAVGGGLNPLMFMLLAEKGNGGGFDKMLPLMLLSQAQGGDAQINPMLMALCLGKGDGDISKLLPLMLLTQGQAGGAGGLGGQNPLLLAMMLGGSDGLEDMLPLLMMSGGMGNLFGNCAGGGACPAPAKPAAN